MSRRFVLAAAIIATAFLAPLDARADKSEDTRKIRASLQAAADAWNEGRIDGVLAPYADDSTFMSRMGLIGPAELRAHYQKKYFAEGQPRQQLRYEKVEVRHLGADHALMSGRWVLTGGAREEQSGWFTLVWERTPVGWRILHDHSS